MTNSTNVEVSADEREASISAEDATIAADEQIDENTDTVITLGYD